MSDFNRSGYSVDWFDGADYAVVIREADDVGIGAYHTDETINEAISNDRAYLAKVDEEVSNQPVAEEPNKDNSAQSKDTKPMSIAPPK